MLPQANEPFDATSKTKAGYPSLATQGFILNDLADVIVRLRDHLSNAGIPLSAIYPDHPPERRLRDLVTELRTPRSSLTEQRSIMLDGVREMERLASL